MAVTATSMIAISGTAHADIVCLLNSDAFQYDAVNSNGGVNMEFTLHAGRGFSWDFGDVIDGFGREWIHGHGAEHPTNTGWILRVHWNC